MVLQEMSTSNLAETCHSRLTLNSLDGTEESLTGVLLFLYLNIIFSYLQDSAIISP